MQNVTSGVPTNAATKWLSHVGLALCLVAALLVIVNQYGTLKALAPYYRINTAALCLLFGFVTACFSNRLAIAGCAFALPLIPTFAWQFQLYTGYGRIQDVASAGLDLVAGIFLGLIANSLWRRQTIRSRLTLPWTAGLVMVILTLSAVVAITRNLHQSASPFTLQALLYNLLHLPSLGWHDDYRPLVDWVAYGIAFLLLAMFIPALKTAPDRNDLIFKPLIVGLIIAALVGLRQSLFGAGLNPSQLNYRLEQFGYMAVGFQPDLHAFAGHMLLGAVGLIGYLYSNKSVSLRVLVLGFVMPLCGAMIFLSKSKSTVAIAIVCLLLITVIVIFRRAKFFKMTALSLCLLTLMLIVSAAVFTQPTVAFISFVLQAVHLPDLGALNLKLSYRPEVYLAALRMFALFPLAGLGQSEFYRQSASYELTHSIFLSVEQNGENAHNYFLQTLAETGLLGFGAFVLLLAYPLLRSVDKRALIPGVVALCAIFGGNLFAHSMLIRENLLLAACFVSLMYAASQIATAPTKDGQMPQAPRGHRQPSAALELLGGWFRRPSIILFCVLIAELLIAKELYQSLKTSPFNFDLQCHEARRVEHDGWTSGRQLFEVPVGARGMILNIVNGHPDSAKRPLEGSLTLWYNRAILLQKDFELTSTGPQRLEIYLPNETIATPDDYQIELQLQRCFVPRNFGINTDGRRLGVNVKSVFWP